MKKITLITLAFVAGILAANIPSIYTNIQLHNMETKIGVDKNTRSVVSKIPAQYTIEYYQDGWRSATFVGGELVAMDGEFSRLNSHLGTATETGNTYVGIIIAHSNPNGDLIVSTSLKWGEEDHGRALFSAKSIKVGYVGDHKTIGGN